jgi:hypothetical protein
MLIKSQKLAKLAINEQKQNSNGNISSVDVEFNKNSNTPTKLRNEIDLMVHSNQISLSNQNELIGSNESVHKKVICFELYSKVEDLY